MNKSSLSLIVFVTLIFVGLVIVQSLIVKPKIPNIAVNPNNGEPAAQVDPMAGEKPADDAATAEENQPEAGAAEQLQGEIVAATREQLPRKFADLGSLSPDSQQPLLVQFDSRGATVRRVELNSRTKRGRLKYRDVENRDPYIGELELKSADPGCEVRFVGPGTPANQAGIVVGDILTMLNDKPIVGPFDFQEQMAKIKAGRSIELTVLRAGQAKKMLLDTTRRPMQVIRPTPPEMLSEFHLKRRPFQFTLKERTQNDWPDLDAEMRTSNWQTQVIGEGPNRVVQFTFDLPKSGDRPALQVIKRFQFPLASEDNPNRKYHLLMDIEVRNLSDEPATFHYELCGPTGMPMEGWWYQQKIHGGTWAIGKMAGARDVITGTDKNPFVFTSGPQIVTNRLDDSRETRNTTLVEKGSSDLAARSIKFMSVDTQYFNVALIPLPQSLPAFSAFGLTASNADESKRVNQRATDISFVIYSDPISVGPYDAANPNSSFQQSFEIFAGPKEGEILKAYNLDQARSFGWFGVFSRPLCWLLGVFYTITGSWSYGLAIILLTVLVRSCMIPISRKAALNAQMMQHLQPEIKQIAEKYKDDMEKRSQAQRELFGKYNYNPFGGCLLMFLQMPIFFGLYRGLSVDIALRDQPLIPGLPWCSNLAGPDQLLNWSSWMPSFLSAETGWLGPYLNILPIFTIVLFLVQQMLFMPKATDDQGKMAQTMMKFMMIFMGFIFFKVAAGLCIYFITSSTWGIIERKMLPKPQLDTSKFDEKNKVTKKKRLGNKTANPLPLKNEKQLVERKKRNRERQRKLRERS